MQTRWARVARGTTAAVFATVVAAVSHVAVGGETPTVIGLGVSLVFSVMMCTLLAGRTLSLARLALSVGASQILFHALFSGLGTPAMVDHEHTTTTMTMVDAVAPHHASGMWVAHTVAALVTIAALRFGEQAFWGLASTARLLLARLVRTGIRVAVFPTSPLARVERRTTPRPTLLQLSPMRHRGPPPAHA